MKNIIFCADGTWNHPKEADKVSLTDTNVYKLYKALPTTATQCPRYDDGVGAGDSFLQHLFAGALGTGLFDKVKEGYTKLAHVYSPAHQTFLFASHPPPYPPQTITR